LLDKRSTIGSLQSTVCSQQSPIAMLNKTFERLRVLEKFLDF
jgi:hypothetical protein